MGKWISIDDELPPIGYKNQVLIYCKREFKDDFEIIMGWLEDYGFCSIFMWEDEDLRVTHWMKLPEPPKI